MDRFARAQHVLGEISRVRRQLAGDLTVGTDRPEEDDPNYFGQTLWPALQEHIEDMAFEDREILRIVCRGYLDKRPGVMPTMTTAGKERLAVIDYVIEHMEPEVYREMHSNPDYKMNLPVVIAHVINNAAEFKLINDGNGDTATLDILAVLADTMDRMSAPVRRSTSSERAAAALVAPTISDARTPHVVVPVSPAERPTPMTTGTRVRSASEVAEQQRARERTMRGRVAENLSEPVEHNEALGYLEYAANRYHTTVSDLYQEAAAVLAFINERDGALLERATTVTYQRNGAWILDTVAAAVIDNTHLHLNDEALAGVITRELRRFFPVPQRQQTSGRMPTLMAAVTPRSLPAQPAPGTEQKQGGSAAAPRRSGAQLYVDLGRTLTRDNRKAPAYLNDGRVSPKDWFNS